MATLENSGPALRPAPVLCRFYTKGCCKYGTRCKDIHQISTSSIVEGPVPSPTTPKSPSTSRRSNRRALLNHAKPCFAFTRKGHCNKADACLYSHDPTVPEVRRLLDLSAEKLQQERRQREAEEEQRKRVVNLIARRAEERQALEEQERQRHADEQRRIQDERDRLALQKERKRQAQDRKRRDEEERARRQEEQRQRAEAERVQRENTERLQREAAARRQREDMEAQAKETLQKVVSMSIVTFSPGLDIQNTITGFECCRIVVKNLPRNVTPTEISDLFLSQGLNESHFHPVGRPRTMPNGKQEATIVTTNEIAENLAAGLNDVEFREERLSFEIGVFNGDGAMGGSGRRSYGLTISCPAPSVRYVIDYATLDIAQAKARELNGCIVMGRKVKAAMNQRPPGRIIPTFNPNSIIINNLPDVVSDDHLKNLAGSFSLRRLKPRTFEIDNAIQALQDHIGRQQQDGIHVNIVSRGDNETGIISVRVHSLTWEPVKYIHDSLADKPFWFIGNSRFWLRLDSPMFYTIFIPPGQYQAQEAMWKELETGIHDRKACTLSIQARNAQDTRIQVSGSDKLAVGALKVRVESIAGGTAVEGWHVSFEHLNHELMHKITGAGAFMRTDRSKQAVKLYGTSGAIKAASAIVKAELIHQHSLEYKVPLKPFQMRYFLHEVVPAMKETFGDESISLEIGTRVLRVKGGEEIRQHLNNYLSKASEHRVQISANDQTCPICYDTASSPKPFLCGHVYCTACLRHFLVNAGDSGTFPLVCIGDGAKCGAPIPIPVIKEFLPQGPFDKLLEAAFISFLNKRPQEYKHCKTPDCGQIYRATPETHRSTLHCPSCFSELCSSCGDAPHDHLSCADARIQNNPEEQERLSQQWFKAQHSIKKCPRCSRLIEKTEGCNHMQCNPGCGAHICWRCLAVFDDGPATYDHLGKVHGGIYGEEPVPNQRVIPQPDHDPFHGLDYHEQAEALQAIQRTERMRRVLDARHDDEVRRLRMENLRQQRVAEREAAERLRRQRELYAQDYAGTIRTRRTEVQQPRRTEIQQPQHARWCSIM